MTQLVAWPVVRLSELAAPFKGSIAGGPFGSDLVSTDYVLEGVPVIRGVNLPNQQRLSLDGLAFVSEAKADSLHLNCAHPGDLVFTQRGTLGQVGLIPKDSTYPRYLISQSQMKMTVDPDKAEPLYLYYYFRLSSTVQYIENHALQAGVPHINLGILRKLEVVRPPISVQRKIAAILSGYDELIANNQRRIALLEGMAEEIYREWFVRMRFPGWQSCPLVGRLPAGWRLLPFSDAVEINPTERLSKSDEVPFVPMDRLSPDSMYFEYEERRTGAAGSKFRNGDSLLPRITPCLENGKRGYVTCLGDGELAVGSTEFIVLRARQLGAEHVYLLAADDGLRKHAEISMTGASGRQRVQEECFNFFLVAVPPDEIARDFKQLVGPMFKEISLLASQVRPLLNVRDSLLPRLISGKLKVDHLDIRLPPSMRAEAEATA